MTYTVKMVGFFCHDLQKKRGKQKCYVSTRQNVEAEFHSTCLLVVWRGIGGGGGGGWFLTWVATMEMTKSAKSRRETSFAIGEIREEEMLEY